MLAEFALSGSQHGQPECKDFHRKIWGWRSPIAEIALRVVLSMYGKIATISIGNKRNAKEKQNRQNITSKNTKQLVNKIVKIVKAYQNHQKG